MRKLIFGLLATAIVAGSIFYACKKNENDGRLLVDKSLSFNNPDTYGALHNDITEHIIKKEIRLIDCDSLKYYTSKENQRRAIDLGIEYCINNNYIDAYSIEPLRNELYHFFDRYEDNDFFVDLYESEDFFVRVLRDAGLSDNMINTQLLIRETVHSINCTPDETVRLFNNILETNPYSLNEEELFKIKIQQSVTNYSRAFWNGETQKKHKEKPRNPNLPPGVQDCAEWTIIMDALGVVLGSVFGPIGAAVNGAVFSIGAKRECECGGKYK